MKFARHIMVAAVLLFSSHAEAAPSDELGDSQLAGCIDAAKSSDLAVRDCHFTFIEREDTRLTIAWKRLMAVVGRKSDVGRALLSEQRAWLAYRKVACQHFDIAGTLNRVQGAMCLADLTTERTIEIKDLTLFYNAGEY